MNEAETRAEHVDAALAAAGWGVAPGSRVRREYPITLGRLAGLPQHQAGLVEAKAWGEELTANDGTLGEQHLRHDGGGDARGPSGSAGDAARHDACAADFGGVMTGV